MEDTNVNPKCTACKCFWKPDETDVKTSGLVCRTCKRCRDISKANNKKYRELNPDKVKQHCQKYNNENADRFKQYQQKYYQDNADKIKQKKQKYRQDNAEIINQRRRKDYQDNTDKFKQRNQKYYQENADKIKQQSQKYYQDNAYKVKQQRKKNRQENKCKHNKEHHRCSICNPPLYLLDIQRINLRRCLKIANLDKTKPTIEYLGCEAVYFKDYIQKKMDIYNETAEIKMDFTNIHIDHIKPVSVFNLYDENEFLDCSHYTNFQPLLAKDNLSKKNKWNEENEAYWNDNIKGKEYYDIYL